MNYISDYLHRYRTLRLPNDRRLWAVLLCVLTLSCRMEAQSPPTLAISLSPANPQFTDTVAVSAKLTGSAGQPTGTVSYTIDGGTAATSTVTNGVAYFPISPLAPGSHTVAVSYSGDGSFGALSAQSQPFTVSDRPRQINGSTYFLNPSIYVAEGGTFSAFGIGGVAVDKNQNVFLAYGTTGPYPVAPAVAEITSGLGYKTLPVQGIGTDVRLAVDPAGNLYLADPTHSSVLEYSTGGVQTTLSIAGLMAPSSITYDAATQSLFILDSNLGGVIQYNLSTQKQTTLFSGVKSLNPAVATDGAGGIYYVSAEQLMFRAADGTTSPIYGQFVPPGTSAVNSTILGLAFDPVRKYLWVSTATGGGMSTIRLDADHHASFVGGSVNSDRGQLNLDSAGKAYTPSTVYTDGPYAANGGPAITQFGAGGIVPEAVVQLPSGSVGPVGGAGSSPGVYSSITQEPIEAPNGYPIGFGAISFPLVLTLSDGTNISLPVYGTGYGQWMISTPGFVAPLTLPVGQAGGIAYAAPYRGYGDTIYVSDTTTDSVKTVVYQYQQNGVAQIYSTGTVAFTGLSHPGQLAADGAGDVWVMDQGAASGGTRVLRRDSNGGQLVAYSAATGDPLGLLQSVSAFAVDGQQAVYLGGTGKSGGTITRVDARGLETPIATGITAPVVLALDAASDVYEVDTTGTLSKITPAGTVTTIASGLTTPTAISLDASNTVYLSSASAKGVLTIAPDGTQNTISIAGVANPTIAVVDYIGSIHVVDGTTQTTYVDYRYTATDTINFGTVAVNSTSTRDYTVTSIGNLALLPLTTTLSQGTYAPFSFAAGPSNGCQFAGAGTPTALAPGQSCQVEFKYQPTKTGTDSASAELDSGSILSIISIGPGLFWKLTGTVTNSPAAAPVPVLAPSSIAFGNIIVGTTSATQTATLSNTGNTPLTVSSLSLSGGGAGSFTETSSCGAAVAAGASCTITLACKPTATGAVSASLSATFPSPLTAQSSTLSCTGTAAAAAQAALTPATTDFGTVTTGTTSAAKTFTLANGGNASLAITSVAVNGSGFIVAGNTCASSLAAGNACTITVTFTPANAGSASATLSVVDAVGTQTAALTGTGAAPTAPQAALTPATASFGDVNVGATGTAQTFTLKNAGTASLTVGSVTLNGTNASVFTIGSNSCGTALAAGASCAVVVSFAPSAAGSATATLSVVDAVGTQTSALSGNGVAVTAPDFAIAATPPTQTSSAGGVVSYAISITPMKGFTQAVALTASGLPTNAKVSFAPASVTPAGGAATSTMTITLPAQVAAEHEPFRTWPAGGSALAAGLLILPLWRRKRLMKSIACLLAVAGMTAAISGCGGGFGLPANTVIATYSITVNGTSGSLLHSTSVQLTVK